MKKPKTAEKPSKLLPYRESGRSVFDESSGAGFNPHMEIVKMQIERIERQRKWSSPRDPAAYRAEVLEGVE